MKKLIFFSFLFFTVSSYCQSSTEKWNDYLKRYERFDANGNLVAYKTYNSYLEQWETYNVSNGGGYKIQPPQSSVNIGLVHQTLSELAGRHDVNLAKLKDGVRKSQIFLMSCAKFDKKLDYNSSNEKWDEYYYKYIKPINDANYDLSSDTTTDYLLNFIQKTSIDFACRELDFCP